MSVVLLVDLKLHLHSGRCSSTIMDTSLFSRIFSDGVQSNSLVTGTVRFVPFVITRVNEDWDLMINLALSNSRRAPEVLHSTLVLHVFKFLMGFYWLLLFCHCLAVLVFSSLSNGERLIKFGFYWLLESGENCRCLDIEVNAKEGMEILRMDALSTLRIKFWTWCVGLYLVFMAS